MPLGAETETGAMTSISIRCYVGLPSLGEIQMSFWKPAESFEG